MATRVKRIARPKATTMGRDEEKEIQFNAFKFRQRGNAGPTIVMFYAPVHQLLKFAEVDRLTPTSKGPQREQKEARVDAIRKFLSANPGNTIPTALILAFSDGATTFKGRNQGTLTVKLDGEMVATIIDGQHRLYGINLYDRDMEMPVIGLLDADPVECAFQFLVINNKSSRVPATHTKALLAKMKNTSLAERLKGAKLAFDVEGIKDVDLVNSDPESPFYSSIDWSTTPIEKRLVQATAIELSLAYLSNLQISEFEDRDVRRSVFLTIWKTIKDTWPKLWTQESRLVSKVGIFCMTRFIVDRITQWADSDDLDIEITDLAQIEAQTGKILNYMDPQFWTAPWAEKSGGGFDTNQGRERVLSAITQLFRNGRRDLPWYSDIEIIDPSATSDM